MTKSKISILIPIYEGKKYLFETISSCVIQDYQGEIEIILIDDGSKEKSPDIINFFLKNNKNISYFENKKNLGLMKTNNKALEICSGEYLIYLGQDDVLPPSHVRLMYENAKKTNASIVWCNSFEIDEFGAFKKIALNYKLQKLKTFLAFFFISKSNFISSTGLMIKASALNSAGGWPTKYKNYGEWLLWINLINNYNISFCQLTNALYRRHSFNLSSFVDKKTLPSDVKSFYSYCQSVARSYFKTKKIKSKILYLFLDLIWKILNYVKKIKL